MTTRAVFGKRKSFLVILSRWVIIYSSKCPQPAKEGLVYYAPGELQDSNAVLAGVAIRIARGVARRSSYTGNMMCALTFQHSVTADKKSLFRWTVVGDPTDRVVNTFYREKVSRLKVNPYDEKFQRHAMEMRTIMKNFYRTEESPEEAVEQILGRLRLYRRGRTNGRVLGGSETIATAGAFRYSIY